MASRGSRTRTKTRTTYTKRKLNRLLSLIIKILAGVLGACVLVFLYLIIFTDVFHPLTRLYRTEIPVTAEVSASSNEIYCLDANRLECIGFDGKVEWETEFSGSNYDINVSDTLVCIYNSNSASVLDADKNVLFSIPGAEYNILNAKCGKNHIALLCSLESDRTLYYVRVFSVSGEEIYRADYESADVLSYDMFGETDNLWVLTLDTSGVSPVSRITTFAPMQNAMTGTLEINDQLVSDVYYSDSNMYLSGTYNMLTYDTFGQKQGSTLVYGLKCIDSAFSGSDYTMVYMQRTDDNISQANTLRVISRSGETERDSFLQLPGEAEAVYTSSNHVYCFMKNKVYIYKLTGEFYKETEFDFNITGSQKIASDKVLLVSEDKVVYYLQLG